MTRDDALLLLDTMRSNSAPQPNEVERMGRLFAHAIRRAEGHQRPSRRSEASKPR
jgi:hypothetical protein